MTIQRRAFLAAGLALLSIQAWGAPRRVTVLSYNIRHGQGNDDRIDLERIARVIRSVSPDVVALQEVDLRAARSGGVDQLAEFARLTGMEAYFAKAIPLQGGEYGNGILSRGRTAEKWSVPLPGREPRVLGAVHTEDGLVMLATHLDVSREDAERLASAERINEWIEARGTAPAILAGDLNCVRGSAPLAKLTERWTIAGSAMATIPAGNPNRQIDFILYRPADRWRVIEVRVLDEPVASDHRPIVAVLELLDAHR